MAGLQLQIIINCIVILCITIVARSQCSNGLTGRHLDRDKLALHMSRFHQLTSYKGQTSTSHPSTMQTEAVTYATNRHQLNSFNIAYGKPTRQYATWRNFGSEKAVDGNTAQLPGSICALSYVDHFKPGLTAWWSVDLAAGDPFKSFVVESVTIFFRECCLERIIGVVVLVGSKDDIDTQKVCATVTTGNSIQTLSCRTSTSIRFLTVKHPTHRFLGLCEVIVNGHQYAINFPDYPLSVWLMIIIGISLLIFFSIVIAVYMIIVRMKARLRNGKYDITALATKKFYVVANVYEPPEITEPLYEVITERSRRKLPIADTNTPTASHINDEQHNITEPLYEEIGENR